MTITPNIDCLREAVARGAFHIAGRDLLAEADAILTENAELVRENDEWKRQATEAKTERDAAERELHALTAPPARRLREYKWVTYRDGLFIRRGLAYGSAVSVIANTDGLTDDDHAPLMDLKAQPWEAGEDKIVDLLNRFLDCEMTAPQCAADLRALVRAEGGAR